jgi:hypothetical protein
MPVRLSWTSIPEIAEFGALVVGGRFPRLGAGRPHDVIGISDALNAAAQ